MGTPVSPGRHIVQDFASAAAAGLAYAAVVSRPSDIPVAGFAAPLAPGHAAARGLPYGLCAAVAIVVVTAARLAWLAVQPADLYPDEAQYWLWAQTPALGYYSKPPLVAWIIAATAALLGEGEFGIRAAAPLLHAAAAGFVYAAAARLYDRRTGFWSALAYASMPGVSLSAFLISTDAVLLPCWAAALFAFIRAREPGGGGWWFAVGIAAGLGLLAKYAMAYWLLSALGFLLLVRGERRNLPAFVGAAALALAIYAPNAWWNWTHGFVSYRHVGDNAHLAGALFHPRAFAEFFLSQFGVFGPVLFALLLAVASHPRVLAEPRSRLLAVFSLPTLAMMLGVSLLSRAQPNWAAPAYVSASILVVAWALGRRRRAIVIAAIGLNFAAAVAVFGGRDALAAAGIAVPAKYDPLHRLRGWRELGQQVAAQLRAYPGLKLLADDRELIAALVYYVRPHPFDAVLWSVIPGVKDQWQLTNNIAGHIGEDFLAVTQHGLMPELQARFGELMPLTSIDIVSGPAGGRRYTLYIARDYRGEPADRR